MENKNDNSSHIKEKCSSCENKTKKRTAEELKLLTNRLNRVLGQVNGVKKMLETDAYCIDILNQTSAAAAALNAFYKELLSAHLKTCVAEHLKQGDDAIVDELIGALRPLMK